MSEDMHRRGVLQGVAVTAAAGLAGEASAAAARPYRVGVIGSGWFGKLDLHALMNVAPVEVVALCDVDTEMLEEARELTFARRDVVTRPRRRAEIYTDYRRMLSRHRFDIVIVGTPDHWHTLPAIAAMEAGAHVYLEKPVSVDVIEGQALVAAARRHNRVVQVGTQRRASPPHIEAKARVVDAGLLGKIGHVEVFCYFHQRHAAAWPETAPPATLDWDAYCGPAPVIPYRDGLHPRNWRSFMEFGNGYMGDVGVHMVDEARWMLGLGWPKRISSTGGVFVDTESPSNIPDTQIAAFEYDNLLMTWTNRQWGPSDLGDQWGFAAYGSGGVLRVSAETYQFTPVNGGPPLSGALQLDIDQFPQDRSYEDYNQTLACLTRHNMRDFIAAIEQGRRPVADIEQGHISTSQCILANIAMKLGRPLTWDANAQRVVGDDEANALLARPYRGPWTHPGA